MRREWIEIFLDVYNRITKRRLPPCGGSGLKYRDHVVIMINLMSPSMRREWIEMIDRIRLTSVHLGLPPCGGSGLKFCEVLGWRSVHQVSLHAEGVD